MGLPPLANVFAARLPDAGDRAEVEHRLADWGELTPLGSDPNWVVGVAPLPGGPADPPELAAAGLIFAEGRDRLISDAPDDIGVRVQKVLDVVGRRPEQLGRFSGDFGFLHVSGDAATVVRSCGGLVPFYIRRLARGGVALATRLDLLVRLLDVEHVADPLVAAITVSGWNLNPDGRTPLRDVSVIPRGCYARLSGETPPRIGRYWDPRPEQGSKLIPSDAHPARLRRSLLTTLHRDLDPAGGNLIGLSGGVDSSVTAALAAGVLGRPCSGLSFLSPAPDTRARDLRYIDSLLQNVEIAPTRRIVLEPGRWLELVDGPLEQVLQIPHPILCAVAELADSEHISVLFGGEAADEMCGSTLTMTDWMDHTSALALVRGGLAALPFGRRDLLRWVKRRLQRITGRIELPYPVRLRPYVRAEVQAEYTEWRDRRLAAARADRRPLLGLALWCEHDGWVAMNWETASALGIRRSLPFYTREVHELAFQCHPGELVGPSTKKLLRAAVRDDVPHVNLFRPDKGGGGWAAGGTWPFAGALPSELRTIVADRFFDDPPASAEAIDVVMLAQLSAFSRRLRTASTAGSRQGT